MCGITGWIDFDKDIRNHEDIILAMTRSLANRGPDDQGVIIEKDFAFGHRRLSIIDKTNGHQPMIFIEQGKPVLALSFCGEIYNYKSLRKSLELEGYTFKTKTDSEVLLAMYHRWQNEMFSMLNGMFAFAIWDYRLGELTLGRDRLGIKPLYYYPLKKGILFGSEQKSILAHKDCERVVGYDELREIMDMVKTPGKAPFRGMYEVCPGEYLKFNLFGIQTKKYWTLEAKEHTDNYENTVGKVSELLNQSVKEHLISDVPISALLSGGLDSSIITMLASKEMHTPASLHTFSMDFHSNLASFTPDAIRSSPDEMFARELALFAGTSHHSILLNTNEMASQTTRQKVLQAVDSPPAYWGDMWPSMYLLFQEVKVNSNVTLSGEGADELFGGYKWFHNPLAISSNTFPWLTPGSTRYFGGSGLFNDQIKNNLKGEEYREFCYCNAIQEMGVISDDCPEEKIMKKISYMNITRFLQTLLDRNDRMSMATGVEVRVPFCDHRLVEYVYNVPWKFKNSQSKEKGLLRDATRKILPSSINERVKTPYPATQDLAYETQLRQKLSKLIEDKNQPIHPMLDIEKTIRNSQRQTGNVSLPYNRGNIEMVLYMNAWLLQYNITLDL